MLSVRGDKMYGSWLKCWEQFARFRFSVPVGTSSFINITDKNKLFDDMTKTESLETIYVSIFTDE